MKYIFMKATAMDFLGIGVIGIGRLSNGWNVINDADDSESVSALAALCLCDMSEWGHKSYRLSANTRPSFLESCVVASASYGLRFAESLNFRITGGQERTSFRRRMRIL